MIIVTAVCVDLAIIMIGIYVIMAAVYHASTRGEPKITYRAFRAIESMAQDKWDYTYATPRYQQMDQYGFGCYRDVYMKTFFDAIRCYFGYILPSRRRQTAAQSNSQMKSLVSSWQEDVHVYADREVSNMIKKMKGGI